MMKEDQNAKKTSLRRQRVYSTTLVAGAGFHLYLRSEQAKMVAGSGRQLEPRMSSKFIAELAHQFKPTGARHQDGALFVVTA
ncbi:hypothetical protein FHW20_004075 [Ochrobactrum intermedium]|uniref:Uncharacterized protein n=2 Tax=Brucella intermedia TaxID=94625 RepID=A0ABR6AUW7_9HYPH|nr:hypothetical protein [Brucella intermedia]